MSGLTLLILTGLGLILLSLYYSHKGNKKRIIRQRKLVNEMKKIITFAEGNDGKISNTEAFQLSDLEMHKVKALLDRLVNKDVFSEEINQEGTFYYLISRKNN